MAQVVRSNGTEIIVMLTVEEAQNLRVALRYSEMEYESSMARTSENIDMHDENFASAQRFLDMSVTLHTRGLVVDNFQEGQEMRRATRQGTHERLIQVKQMQKYLADIIVEIQRESEDV